MNKIICDICGTAYPENAEQCPICGCAKPADTAAVSVEGLESGAPGSYTYVKGGRFSKSNVKKRSQATAAARYAQEANEEEPEEESSNKGLIITAIILLLAIVAVAFYIYFNFFRTPAVPAGPSGDTQNPGISQTTDPATSGTAQPSTTQPPVTDAPTTTQPTADPGIPCTGLSVSEQQITLSEVGHAWLLNVTAQPDNCTDKVSYETSDASVATVTAEGRVTAVGPGQAVITVTCGTQTITCNVVCNIETQPQTTAPTEPTEVKLDWGLNRKDITFASAGESWNLYKGSVSKTKVTFSSDDESIAVFDNGKVTAVGPGVTNVHAEYEGVKYSCIIRCVFKSTTTGEIGPDTGGTDEPQTGSVYTVSPNGGDATIEVGMSVNLALKDSKGKAVDVTWKPSNTKYCSISGNKVTGKAVGNVTFTTSYRGKTYECVIRVIAGAQG